MAADLQCGDPGVLETLLLWSRHKSLGLLLLFRLSDPWLPSLGLGFANHYSMPWMSPCQLPLLSDSGFGSGCHLAYITYKWKGPEVDPLACIATWW